MAFNSVWMSVSLASLLSLAWMYGPLLKQLCLHRCPSCAFSWVAVLVPVLFSLVPCCLMRGRLLALRLQPGTWAMSVPPPAQRNRRAFLHQPVHWC